LVDYREMRSGVPAALGSLGVVVRQGTLRSGDYAIGTDTRIERKTVADLHACVISRRLWAQINRLRASTTFPIVLV